MLRWATFLWTPRKLSLSWPVRSTSNFWSWSASLSSGPRNKKKLIASTPRPSWRSATPTKRKPRSRLVTPTRTSSSSWPLLCNCKPCLGGNRPGSLLVETWLLLRWRNYQDSPTRARGNLWGTQIWRRTHKMQQHKPLKERDNRLKIRGNNNSRCLNWQKTHNRLNRSRQATQLCSRQEGWRW